MANAPVVADTSPLIKLVGVGLLDLLPRLYGALVIPEQVYAEYQAGAHPNDPDLQMLPWLAIQPVTIEPVLLDELDLGEAAVITLAHTVQARAILMDDRAGRHVARQRGLPVIGTLAVLLRAKHLSFLPAVGPIIDIMIAQGRYISPALRDHVLRAAGELPT